MGKFIVFNKLNALKIKWKIVTHINYKWVIRSTIYSTIQETCENMILKLMKPKTYDYTLNMNLPQLHKYTVILFTQISITSSLMYNETVLVSLPWGLEGGGREKYAKKRKNVCNHRSLTHWLLTLELFIHTGSVTRT
jgi:hypothetical protein